MNKIKVLITGGAGFIGTHVAESYAPEHHVVVLDNLMRSALLGVKHSSVEHNWNYLSEMKKKGYNIELVKADIRDTAVVQELIKNSDLVVHAAAQTGIFSSLRKPYEDFEVNTAGTLNILESIRKYADNACFIYLSTNKVYGTNPESLGVVERNARYDFEGDGVDERLSADYTSHTPYGVSKYAGELYTQEYSRTYGIRSGVFRMSCIYGPRQFGFEDQGWVAHFIISAVTKKPITIFGDGKQVRDLLYVSDLVEAFDKFFNSKIKHEVFNIGGGRRNSVSLLELLGKLEALTGLRPQVRFSEWREADQKVYISDISKISSMLEWKPTVDVETGLKKTLEWVEKNKKLFS